MELKDCGFDLLYDVETHANLDNAFKNADYGLLIGCKARKPGQTRAELLSSNGQIFVDTGKAISDNANRDIKVIVVGNPCNTNALVL